MFVYWIRLPKHTDITSQGYIGIASNFKQRMFAHKSCAKTGKEQTLYKAIRKHGWNNLTKEIVLISGNDYCLEIEKKLRSSERIGWNIACGGGEITGAHLKGKKQSAEHVANRKKALVGRMSGMKGKTMPREAIEKTMQSVRGIAKTDEHKKKISIAKSKQLIVNNTIYPSWKIASQKTGIPLGSISYLLKNHPKTGKWANYKIEEVM